MCAHALCRQPDQLRIAGCQTVTAHADIVLEPGAHRVRASNQRPVHHAGLVHADARRRPGRVRQQQPDFAQHQVQQPLLGRQSVLYAHDHLHMWPLIHQPGVDQPARTVDVTEVKQLDLRPDPVRLHARSQVGDQPRRVFVHDRREIDRPGRERRHVRRQIERVAPRRLVPPPPTGAELHDHARAMPAHALLHL